MTQLELTGVKKSYGALTVVDRVSLKIHAGESVGIIGPNGAGKSSLFHVISGVVPVDEGTVQFNGHDITRTASYSRCRAGIARAYQVPRPFSGMSVFENLLVGATFGAELSSSEAREKCGILLQQTGLINVANVPAGSLRLLDRKRLELAKALSTNPQLLLLDEIAGGLTEDECDKLMLLIQSAQASGITVVWIEHVVRTLMQFAKRLIVLDFGSILADGEPQTVWARDDVQKRYVGIES